MKNMAFALAFVVAFLFACMAVLLFFRGLFRLLVRKLPPRIVKKFGIKDALDSIESMIVEDNPKP